MSDETDELAKALAELQSRCGGVKKSGRNPHFKSVYSTLGDVWAVIRPHLPELGLSITQWPVRNAETREAGVRTVVRHVSGKKDEDVLLLPVGGKGDIHAVGSAVSYAKRYVLLGIAGIADDDDDGHAASQAAQQSRSSGAQRTNGRGAGNQSARPTNEQHAPPQREIPQPARAVHAALLKVDHDEARRFAGFACSAADETVLGKGCEQAVEVLLEICGHQHSTLDAKAGATTCDRCGWVLPEDEPPGETAEAEAQEAEAQEVKA